MMPELAISYQSAEQSPSIRIRFIPSSFLIETCKYAARISAAYAGDKFGRTLSYGRRSVKAHFRI